MPTRSDPTTASAAEAAAILRLYRVTEGLTYPALGKEISLRFRRPRPISPSTVHKFLNQRPGHRFHDTTTYLFKAFAAAVKKAA